MKLNRRLATVATLSVLSMATSLPVLAQGCHDLLAGRLLSFGAELIFAQEHRVSVGAHALGVRLLELSHKCRGQGRELSGEDLQGGFLLRDQIPV